MRLDQDLRSILDMLDFTHWASINREESSGRNEWCYKVQWWNNKYYWENPPNDGSSEQEDRFDNREIPWERRLFYPSPEGRFSLGDSATVAYFSLDFSVNCCETIDYFSGQPALRWEELEGYFAGKGNPTPGWVGHPIPVKLCEGTLLLDVSKVTAPFFRRLRKITNDPRLCSRFFDELKSREDSEKKATQELARVAHSHGFEGIIYASARAPIDIGLPDKNLVVFSQDVILRE